MPATAATLRTYLGIDPASAVDQAALDAAVAASNDLVQVLRADLTHDDAGALLPDWPPRVDQAALVEAARLYGRRGSVQGIAAFADVGVSMIPRLDPEVRSLLELGEYQPPVVAQVDAFARALELAQLLTDAGLVATIDPRSATPPCVLGVPPNMRFDLACGFTAEWQWFAIVPGPANADAWKALSAMVETCAGVLDVTRADFVSYALSPDSPTLPAYRIQLEEGL